MKQTFFIMVVVITIVCLTYFLMTKKISHTKFPTAVDNPRNRGLALWSQDPMVKLNSSHPTQLPSNELNQLPDNNHPSSILKAMPLSKDLVVYGAYFDGRQRNQHTNITMIFIAASKTAFQNNLITGCGVGNVQASSFKVRYVQEDILMHNWLGINKFPFEQLAVECYDIDVINGSRAFVMHKLRNDSIESLVVESEKPLWIPAPRIKPSGKHNFTVLVCTKAHNKGVTYLPEFLRYQKTLGVDHVHLTIQDAYIKDGGFGEQLMNDTFFKKAVQDNFVSVRVWREWYEDNENYVHSAILQYLECIYQYRGTYDYVSLMDSDDFFVPRVPGKVYKDYIQEYCYEKPAGSCSFKWLWYYPDVCGMKDKVGEDGNVTAHLVPHRGVYQSSNLKSIHSAAAIVDSSFHDATCAQCLLPGYKVVHIPPDIAYVAHNRKYTGRNKEKVCHN